MLEKLWQMLDVEPNERGPVSLLLIISFFMGLFLATVAVASQSLFLQHFSEQFDLPKALAFSGLLGMAITFLYNFLQGRVSFTSLADLSSDMMCTFNLLLGSLYYQHIIAHP